MVALRLEKKQEHYIVKKAAVCIYKGLGSIPAVYPQGRQISSLVVFLIYHSYSNYFLYLILDTTRTLAGFYPIYCPSYFILLSSILVQHLF